MIRNNLDLETSPYLLQHRDNPVHWQPWASATLELAQRENRPVLLSIGYAACHWCHVMAHESFEDPAVAALMNEHFINIKVDREERPDLDAVYQAALALLGQHGGWPLTMFLTPSGEPFWGGTYFPPTSRYGRPGFRDVLTSVAEIYSREPDKVAKNVSALRDALAQLSRPANGGDIALDVSMRVAQHLVDQIDPQHGGLRGAPKFPQVPVLELLWRAWKRGSDRRFRDAVVLTLDRMSQGGIYDHLGGGFARYSVDEKWLVPHFEKMLYDNAQLIALLTLVFQDTRDRLYRERVEETVGWVLREMRAAAGSSGHRAFASSLDADSEGEEGKFYVWSAREIDDLLHSEAGFFKQIYDVTAGGNWEGHNILNRIAHGERRPAEEESFLARCRARLFAARERRVRPGWDDKVLADWNGLMIAALAEASLAFDRPEWLAAATDAFAFVAADMSRDGRLFHSWRDGVAKHPATLDDYAHLCRAGLALHEATGDDSYLRQVETWTAVLDRHYWDAGAGGYFLTADDTTDVIIRPKNATDGSVPSGNGAMAAVLAQLYHLTGTVDYRDRADALVRAFSGDIGRNYFALATLLNGNEFLQTAVQIVIVGDRDHPDTRAMLDSVYGKSIPNRVCTLIGETSCLRQDHPAAGKTKMNGRATAYVCRGTICSLPITTPSGLARALALG